jgi:putative membrane protein
MSAPDLWILAVQDWHPALAPDLGAAGASIVYGHGVRRMRGAWPSWRTVSFLAGVSVGLIALQSGYDSEDGVLLSAHMVQHLLLLELAPLLVLAGRPVMLCLRAAPRHRRAPIARGLTRLRGITHPFTCLLAFSLIVSAAHLPAFYDATLRDPLLHEGEHAAFFVAGLLMWWPVLDGEPVARRRLGGVARLSYVMIAMLPMTLIGADLNRATTVVYRAYIAPDHALGLSAVGDQQHAGAIMWVLGSAAMIVVGIWQTMAALLAEERRHQQAERRMDAHAERASRAST